MEDTSCGPGKDVNLFQRGQIIGRHQAKKISKEIAGTTKIGLRTVECIIKNWKDSGEQSSSRKKCGRKKFWMNQRDQRSLKCLVKLNNENNNRTPSYVKYSKELLSLLVLESKSISPMWIGNWDLTAV